MKKAKEDVKNQLRGWNKKSIQNKVSSTDKYIFFERFIKLIKQQPNTFDTWSLKVKSIDEINFLPLVFVQVSRAIAELE